MANADRAERFVKELTNLRNLIKRGERVDTAYTVKTIRLDLTPREFDNEAVLLLRKRLGVSQAIFARILAVSTKQVSMWEQGARPIGPMAARLLESVERDVRYWRRKLYRHSVRVQKMSPKITSMRDKAAAPAEVNRRLADAFGARPALTNSPR